MRISLLEATTVRNLSSRESSPLLALGAALGACTMMRPGAGRPPRAHPRVPVSLERCRRRARRERREWRVPILRGPARCPVPIRRAISSRALAHVALARRAAPRRRVRPVHARGALLRVGPRLTYVVVIDGGSQGSRVHVYSLAIPPAGCPRFTPGKPSCAPNPASPRSTTIQPRRARPSPHFSPSHANTSPIPPSPPPPPSSWPPRASDPSTRPPPPPSSDPAGPRSPTRPSASATNGPRFSPAPGRVSTPGSPPTTPRARSAPLPRTRSASSNSAARPCRSRFAPSANPPKSFASSSSPRKGNGPCTPTAPSVSDRRRRARRTRRRSSRPSHRTVREPSRIRVHPGGTRRRRVRTATPRRVRRHTLHTPECVWNLAGTSRRVARPWVDSSGSRGFARTRVAASGVRICRLFAVVSWRLKISTTRRGSSRLPERRRWRTSRRRARRCAARSGTTSRATDRRRARGNCSDTVSARVSSWRRCTTRWACPSGTNPPSRSETR